MQRPFHRIAKSADILVEEMMVFYRPPYRDYTVKDGTSILQFQFGKLLLYII